MGDFTGSGSVQNISSGLEMWQVLAIPLALHRSDGSGDGELRIK